MYTFVVFLLFADQHDVGVRQVRHAGVVQPADRGIKSPATHIIHLDLEAGKCRGRQVDVKLHSGQSNLVALYLGKTTTGTKWFIKSCMS